MLWISSAYGDSEAGRSPSDYLPLGGPGGISGRVSPRLRVCGGKGSGELPLRGAVESLATAFPFTDLSIGRTFLLGDAGRSGTLSGEAGARNGRESLTGVALARKEESRSEAATSGVRRGALCPEGRNHSE